MKVPGTPDLNPSPRTHWKTITCILSVVDHEGLQVHTQCSSLGRLGIVASKLVFCYKKRLEVMNINDSSDALVRHAYCEQSQLNLKWHGSIIAVRNRLSGYSVEESKTLAWPNPIRIGFIQLSYIIIHI